MAKYGPIVVKLLKLMSFMCTIVVSVLRTKTKIRRYLKRKEEPVCSGNGGTQGTSALLQFLETCAQMKPPAAKRKDKKRGQPMTWAA